MSAREVCAVSSLVRPGEWTTYQEVGEVVYGHGHAGQPVGTAIRQEGHETYAHRILRRGGKVADLWQGIGGGPEACKDRLREEGVWDDTRDRARPEAFIAAETLQQRA